MTFKLPVDPALLGLRLSGDIGGITLYQTKRGKTVAYPAASPKQPPSIHQLHRRNRWSNAVFNWTAAAESVRIDYEACTLRLSLPATGHNLWMHLSFAQDPLALAAFNHASGLHLPMPPPV